MSQFLEQTKPERLLVWPARMSGARQMLMALLDHGFVDMGKNMGRNGRGSSKAHHEALRQWLLESLDNIEIFLTESYRITYGDFENDKKGKCVKCKVKLKQWKMETRTEIERRIPRTLHLYTDDFREEKEKGKWLMIAVPLDKEEIDYILENRRYRETFCKQMQECLKDNYSRFINNLRDRRDGTIVTQSDYEKEQLLQELRTDSRRC